MFALSNLYMLLSQMRHLTKLYEVCSLELHHVFELQLNVGIVGLVI